MGGYGRFEGATGSIAFEINAYRSPTSYLVTTETGIVYGKIILALNDRVCKSFQSRQIGGSLF